MLQYKIVKCTCWHLLFNAVVNTYGLWTHQRSFDSHRSSTFIHLNVYSWLMIYLCDGPKLKIVVKYLAGKLMTLGIYQCLHNDIILTRLWRSYGGSIIENSILMNFDTPYDPMGSLAFQRGTFLFLTVLTLTLNMTPFLNLNFGPLDSWLKKVWWAKLYKITLFYITELPWPFVNTWNMKRYGIRIWWSFLLTITRRCQHLLLKTINTYAQCKYEFTQIALAMTMGTQYLHPAKFPTPANSLECERWSVWANVEPVESPETVISLL
jgi:L-lactate permease